MITPAKAPTPLSEPEGQRYFRLREDFEVELAADASRFFRRWWKGRVRYRDDSGLGLTSERPVRIGQKIRVRFVLPPSISLDFAGLRCTFAAVVRAVRPAPDGKGFEAHLDWEASLSKLVDGAIASHRFILGVAVSAVLGVMLCLKWMSMDYFWYDPFLYVYSIIIGGYFLSRFLFAAMHKPPEPVPGFTPSLSVVVSVRNERDVIARTVESIFAADYPNDKREVIVVNDGSNDGTDKVLEETQKRFPQLRVYTLPPSGKRHGMATGVRAATGELVVFIDSDTLLHKTALRWIVCGFEDPSLGAASGMTGVENVDANLLTRMQEVRYFLSYRLMKSSEGTFDVVSCCPGCLSAYRRSYLLEILDPWLNQMFLGAKATFGDDRSLTNFILRKYRVIYNPKAYSTTMVPETWKRYLTQQVRWKKSWLRETLIASRFMWKKHPIGALSFYIAAMCSTLSPLMVFHAFWWEMSHHDASLLYYLSGLLLVGFAQCLYFLRMRPNKNWLLGMVFVASQVVLLGPQTYYAMLTMRRNHWGTR